MTDASGAPRARHFWTALACLALLAWAVRILFLVAVDPEVPAIGDASAYHHLANNLADGHGYIRPFDYELLGLERPTAEYPPLFSTLLAVPSLAGAESVDAHRMFAALMGVGGVVLVGLLGRRVHSENAGLVAAALAALWPMLFLSEGILMAEALYVPLVTASLLCAYRAFDSPTPIRFLGLGLVLGLATLTRAEGALLALILVVPLCFNLPNVELGRRFLALVFAVVGFALLVVPWTARNAVQLDAFVPVSNNSATLVDGANCDLTYSGDQLGLWRETFSTFGDEARALPQPKGCFEGFAIADPNFEEAEVAERHLRAGLGYAREHVGSWPKVATVRVLRTWGLYAPSQQINFESLEGRPRGWQRAGTIVHWIALPFAIAGLIVLVRRRAYVWPLVAPLITVVLVAAMTYGQQRFRAAAEPVLITTAGVSLVELARSTGSRRTAPG
jgi:4-amino-4-deoxy-L-arabinose transferase-like glycosyltransferase